VIVDAGHLAAQVSGAIGAVARPMPREAPVLRATFPSNDMSKLYTARTGPDSKLAPRLVGKPTFGHPSEGEESFTRFSLCVNTGTLSKDRTS